MISDDRIVESLYVTVGYVVAAAIVINIAYIIRNWRNPSDIMPTFFFTFTFVGSICLIVALHRWFGLPFPYERTGLYLIPLATMNVVLAGLFIASRSRARPISWIWFGYLAVLLVQYGNEVKIDRYQEWDFDAGTKRTILQLQRIHQARPGARVHLGASWVFEPSVEFYRKVWRLDWLDPVTREGPEGQYDYYYLTDEDKKVMLKMNLITLYEDPVSKAVLAAAK
jgi:hypothetical protein